MDAHLKDKDIDRLVSGMMGRREKLRAEEHIEKCSMCMNKTRVLSGILGAVKNDSVPGDQVRLAVLDEWHRMNSRTVIEKKKPSFVFRFAYGLAAVILVTVSIYLGRESLYHSGYEAGLSVSSTAGEVLINNSPPETNSTFKKGDLLVTGTGSSASLAAENYRLEIEGSTELSLHDADREQGYAFNLKKGSLVSESRGRLKYSFTCGRYMVTPAGTMFRIEFTTDKLLVSVFNGMVVVSAADFRVEVPAGMKWDSADHGRTMQIDSVKTAEENRISAGGVDARKDQPEHDAAPNTGEEIRNERGLAPDEIRGLRREVRDDIKEMKKESRRERQVRGGN